MPDLKEILKDKARYQDALSWQLENGVNVTLGQLRALSSEDQASITKAETKLASDRAVLDAENNKLRTAQTNTANLYSALQNATAAIKAGKYDDPSLKQLFGNDAIPGSNGGGNNNDPYAILDKLANDTLLGPVVQAIKLVNAESRKAQEAVAANQKVQEKMAASYINGVLEDRYERIVPADKQDKITMETLIKSAVAANQFSSDGTPNIKWAFKAATAGDAQAEHDAKVAADAVKKFQEGLAANGGGGGSDPIFVGQPSTFGLDVHNRSGKAPKAFKSLDDAFAAAANDKDIWANVDQTLQ